MVLVIDNYDSFTYNLVQYLGEMTEVEVVRNDRIDIKEIRALNPEKIVISPGPGHPQEAGISCQVITSFQGIIPILGVCLGHQCIGHVFGASIVRAENLFHGKTSDIYCVSRGRDDIFSGIVNPFSATRYHSLIIDPETIPLKLEVNAVTVEGEIMAIKHISKPLYGLQFHPESILTEPGKEILRNFINL